jgi:hypothetical protein
MTSFNPTIEGRIIKFMSDEGVGLKKANLEGTKTTSRKLKTDIRAAVNRTFAGRKRLKSGGTRLGNTIRDRLFRNERGPLAYVFTKFGRRGPGGFVDFLVPFVNPGREVVRPKNKRFLFISFARTRKKRLERPDVKSDPKLHFQPAGDGSGKIWIVKRSPRGKRTQLIAALIPGARLKTRLSITRPVKDAEKRLPKSILDNLARENP